MTRLPSAVRRVALPLSAALVGGTFAAISFAAPAHAADVNVKKDFEYQCDVTAGGLPLGVKKVGVNASAPIPQSVYPGQKVPARKVGITLTMPEDLRDASYGLLSARQADGASTDAYISLSSGGATTTIKIPSLSAGKTPIPPNVNDVWTIPASGTVPAFTVPANVKTTATLSVPAKFSIVARIYRADGTSADAALKCVGPANLALASVKIVNAPKPKNVKPKFAKKSYAIKTKKNKAKSIKVKATDANRDKLTYKLAKKTKKGKVTVKKNKVTFKPKKGFTGKTSFQVSVSDGKGGVAKVTVKVTVKKK